MPYWSDWMAYDGKGCPVPHNTFMQSILVGPGGEQRTVEGTVDSSGSDWDNTGTLKVTHYRYMKWAFGAAIVELAKNTGAWRIEGEEGPLKRPGWRKKLRDRKEKKLRG